jgi:hypothetical protein
VIGARDEIPYASKLGSVMILVERCFTKQRNMD